MILDKHIGLYTDLYELTMAQGYFYTGKMDGMAVFDYFFRSNPFGGGYVVFAGLDDLLDMLENIKFDEEDLNYLKGIGFHEDFLNYLKDFKFTGDVYSVDEGEVVFPREPVLRVHARLIEAQILETLVLNILNFQSLIATKASRVKIAARDKNVIEFGLRRAQGLGGISATRAAAVGGVDISSNVLGCMLYDIPPSGTMAHSWVQSFDSELEAFREYAKIYGGKTILLIDTYDTIKSGLYNAIHVAKEMEEKGVKIFGVRLDSGDLITLSKHCRKVLDDHGLSYIKIVVSSMLDEFIIDKALRENAPIDYFGVGTKLSTGKDDAALDGVYKLTSIDGKPKIKISDDPEKVLLPGIKNIVRYYDDEGFFKEDRILLNDSLKEPEEDEEVLLKKVFSSGKRVFPRKKITEITAFSKKRLDKLPHDVNKLQNPLKYNVKICSHLKNLLDEIIKTYKR